MDLAVSGLVAEGLTNPEIGERMHFSLRTVERQGTYAPAI